MHRRSQGDDDLVDLHTDISAVERGLRRAQNRAANHDSIRAEMETGQGSGEGNAAHSSPDHQPDVTADDVEDLEEPPPRHHSPPVRVRQHHRQQVEVDEREERIGSYDEPGTRTARTGIPTPRIPNANFRINNGLLQTVQNSCFNGLSAENPLDHLDMFERICAMYKVNGVPMDTMMMMFFPFSLETNARKWERSTPSELLSTWDDIRKEFLAAFFPKHKTEKIRADISGFRQSSSEAFPQAWARFRSYLQACPHHGFGKGTLLGTFYRGCRPRYRELLDSGSGGSFSDNTVREGEILITKMAKNGHSDEEDYDRERPSRYDAGGIHEVREKMEKVHLPKSAIKEVHFVDEEYGQDGIDHYLEANVVDNHQDYQNRNFNNNSNNSSWRSNNNNSGTYQPPRPYNNNQGQRPFYNNNQDYSQNRTYNNSGNYQKPYQTGQNSNQGSYQSKAPYAGNSSSSGNNRQDPNEEMIRMMRDLGKQFQDLKGQVDGMAAHMKVLDNQVAAIASTPKPNGKGVLPGKPEENPKDFCQHLGSDEDSDDNSEEVITRGAEPQPREYVPRIPFPCAVRNGRQRMAVYEKAIAALKTIEESTEKEYLLQHDCEFKTHYDSLLACKKWHENRNWNQVDMRPYSAITFSHDNFASRLASSARPLAIKLEEVVAVEPEAPNVVEMFESERAIERVVKKREDPGCFTVPCLINGVPFEKCVLDLGASKSVMPLHVSRDVLLGGIEKTNTTLTLADWSTISPVGIARDVSVTLQGHIVPTDFLIVDTNGRSNKIIFGRPFLSSAGAEIKVRQGQVNFKMDAYTKKVKVWRDPDPDIIRMPFDPIKANYLQDLAAMTYRHTGYWSEPLPSSGMEEADWSLGGFDPGWNRPPDLRRLRLSDGAGPSRTRTIYALGDEGAGTSKSSEDNEGGEALPPSNFEIDPGDFTTANPGDLSHP